MKLLKKANSNEPRSDADKINMINAAAEAYGQFLTALGFDWKSDPNSEKTPLRVAKAWVNDLASGCFDSKPHVSTFPNDDEDDSMKYDGMVAQLSIPVVSLCSHHNLPFTGLAHVAYIPGEKVIGLSKLNRIVDWFARRPQIQEGLTMQIHNYLNEICEGNKGIAVVIECNHSCCSNRGIKHSSTMKTAKLSGVFIDNNDKSREEFYQFIATLK